MRVIPPINMTDAKLTSSSVPENDHPAWSASTAYTVGAKVIRTTTHRIYERLVAGTTSGQPELDDANWLDIGPTNRWGMFDLERNSQTVSASNITLVIAPGQRLDAFALVGVHASSISITMTSGGVTRYSYTQGMQRRLTRTWTEYFFGQFKNQSAIVRFDLPAYSNSTITVIINTLNGQAKVGGLVLGQSSYIGKVLVDPESDRISFSKIERDAFGSATLVKRQTKPKTTQTLYMDASLVPIVEDLRKELESVPAIYSGMDDRDENSYFDALLIMGIYRSWPIRMTSSRFAQATLTLEEI